MAEILAESVLTVAEVNELGPAGIRDLVRTLHLAMRDKGFAPSGYTLEGRDDAQAMTTTFRAIAIDPMERTLHFDDRGIV